MKLPRRTLNDFKAFVLTDFLEDIPYQFFFGHTWQCKLSSSDGFFVDLSAHFVFPRVSLTHEHVKTVASISAQSIARVSRVKLDRWFATLLYPCTSRWASVVTRHHDETRKTHRGSIHFCICPKKAWKKNKHVRLYGTFQIHTHNVGIYTSESAARMCDPDILSPFLLVSRMYDRSTRSFDQSEKQVHEIFSCVREYNLLT